MRCHLRGKDFGDGRQLLGFKNTAQTPQSGLQDFNGPRTQERRKLGLGAQPLTGSHRNAHRLCNAGHIQRRIWRDGFFEP